MTDADKPWDIGELALALSKAQAAYDEAEREEARARSLRCDALNRLNAAQRTFGAAYDQLVKAAPRDSDWKAAERRKQAIAA
jgi:ribosomal protein L20